MKISPELDRKNKMVAYRHVVNCRIKVNIKKQATLNVITYSSDDNVQD